MPISPKSIYEIFHDSGESSILGSKFARGSYLVPSENSQAVVFSFAIPVGSKLNKSTQLVKSAE